MKLLVNIDVDDLARAVDFYTAAFDVRIGRHLGPDCVELLGDSAHLYLLAKPRGSRATPHSSSLRTYDRHWTPVHLDVVVADIDAALERAVAAGAKLEQPVQASRWGKLALLADPFGHGFCLVQFVGKGYDEIATG